MAFYYQKVLEVKHWNDTLFSFKTTRPESLKFHNGHFVMLGLEVEGKPLMRAYSIASANYAEHLEFLSIKVPDGPLTSRLQHLQKNDTVMVSMKPVGTLVIHDLTPAKNLYLFATGTGLAPFMSIVRDFETYERFDKIILVHGVRYVSELAYHDYLLKELTDDEYIGDMVKEKLIYYPTVTREPFKNQGRLTDLITNGKLCKDIGLALLTPETDRAMICGSPSMLKDTCKLLDDLGFRASTHTGDVSDYVIERSFVEK
ncbi:ferredoxin--NADP reductase [Shewanella sp. Arc9-LZ]|jgi:ferredoxin--NADP+ reductase|uniref:ferredoxin--NADP reductase n=1 Tax=Shewanella sp. Arc9-LZ TaxID=2698686 RepID=UPI00137B9F46|nr:ferredoxin--NADP reductase [Shewanella sp. Arc9-LZ]QHS15033.1 ferredoxin--NADP reductase [Shewanella sp. Arc9-LZ]